jgi:hypothetical protein
MENTTNSPAEVAGKEPRIIEGTINYKITITDSDFNVENETTQENDLAAVLIAYGVTQNAKTNVKTHLQHQPKDKFLNDRLNKLGYTETGLSILASGLIHLIENKQGTVEIKIEPAGKEEETTLTSETTIQDEVKDE